METTIPLWGVIALTATSILIPSILFFIRLWNKVENMGTQFDLKLAEAKAKNKEDIATAESKLSNSIQQVSDNINRMVITVTTLAEGISNITRLLERHEKQIVDLETNNIDFYKRYGGLLNNLKNE